MVEARQRVDQFDANILSEGVIIYRVQTNDPLGRPQPPTAPIELLTTTALAAGQAFTSDNGVKVQVNNAVPGGFSISVDDPTIAVTIVPDVTYMSAGRAANLVQAAGLVPQFSGPNHPNPWVYSQSPSAGQVVAGGSTVSMVLHTGPLP